MQKSWHPSRGIWWVMVDTKHASPKLQLRLRATDAPGLTRVPQKAHVLPKLPLTSVNLTPRRLVMKRQRNTCGPLFLMA